MTKNLAPTPTPLNPPLARGDITELLALIARLRQDCPWDKKQTNKSLIPYVIEEAYELAEAIQDDEKQQDDEELKSELGDVLLQVVLHSQLYAEQNRFDFSDIVKSLEEKMIRRHPHVFDAENLADAEAVKQRWNEIKQQELAEKISRGKAPSKLDAVKAASSLVQAQELQKQAAKVGFDWDNITDAVAKLDEEIAELKELIPQKHTDMSAQHRADIEKELGDCIFSLVNVARKLDIDTETASLTGVHKFRSRFNVIEQQLALQGKDIEEATLEEMDELWELAKQQE